MEYCITLRKKLIPYTLTKSAKAKYVRLSISPDGALRVTAPRFLPVFLVQKLLLLRGDWIFAKIAHFQSLGISKAPLTPKARRQKYLEHKERARALAERRTAHWNQFYGFTYKNISIRDQKTRWGSCSKKGNLNFNYKIALMPEHLADYIIVHELCHLRAFDHSDKFWSLVAATVPDHKECRKELRKFRFDN